MGIPKGTGGGGGDDESRYVWCGMNDVLILPDDRQPILRSVRWYPLPWNANLAKTAKSSEIYALMTMLMTL